MKTKHLALLASGDATHLPLVKRKKLRKAIAAIEASQEKPKLPRFR